MKPKTLRGKQAWAINEVLEETGDLSLLHQRERIVQLANEKLPPTFKILSTTKNITCIICRIKNKSYLKKYKKRNL